MQSYNDNVATLTSTNTGVQAEAEVDNFREHERFDAWIAQQKIRFKWNGKAYVGNMGGMEFVSDGPKIN